MLVVQGSYCAYMIIDGCSEDGTGIAEEWECEGAYNCHEVDGGQTQNSVRRQRCQNESVSLFQHLPLCMHILLLQCNWMHLFRLFLKRWMPIDQKWIWSRQTWRHTVYQKARYLKTFRSQSQAALHQIQIKRKFNFISQRKILSQFRLQGKLNFFRWNLISHHFFNV